MIVTRTIPVGTLNIGAFVIEMRLNLTPTKFFDLISYRDDGALDNFKIDVYAGWNAADDLALDALIAAHNPANPRLAVRQDRYKFYPITVPFSTNSNVFQQAFIINFDALVTWTLELNFFLQISMGSSNQTMEFELRLNGVPFLTNNLVRMHNSAVTPYGGSGPLQGLVLGNNTVEVYIRNATGAALVTLQGGLLTTKRFLIP